MGRKSSTIEHIHICITHVHIQSYSEGLGSGTGELKEVNGEEGNICNIFNNIYFKNRKYGLNKQTNKKPHTSELTFKADSLFVAEIPGCFVEPFIFFSLLGTLIPGIKDYAISIPSDS